MLIIDAKEGLIPLCNEMNRSILKLTDIFLNLQLAEDMSSEDAEDIKEGLQATRNIHFAISTLNQIYHTLGTKRDTERYFNVVGDEVIEVDKCDYVGSIDDSE